VLHYLLIIKTVAVIPVVPRCAAWRREQAAV
jgi:hypothetical protein